MMSEDRKRQLWEDAWNIMNYHKVDNVSLTQLETVQVCINLLHKEQKEQEFEKDKDELLNHIKQFVNKYPSATWYVGIECDGCTENVDLLDYINDHSHAHELEK